MDDGFPLLTDLPQLSAEALALILRRDTAPVVDLSAFVALQGDYRPCVVKAAIRWGLPPEAIEIVGREA